MTDRTENLVSRLRSAAHFLDEYKVHLKDAPPSLYGEAADEIERLRVALVTCGNYLANRNAGRADGFNAACRAVEVALDVDSVSRCRQYATPKEHAT